MNIYTYLLTWAYIWDPTLANGSAGRWGLGDDIYYVSWGWTVSWLQLPLYYVFFPIYIIQWLLEAIIFVPAALINLPLGILRNLLNLSSLQTIW